MHLSFEGIMFHLLCLIDFVIALSLLSKNIFLSPSSSNPFSSYIEPMRRSQDFI